MNSIQKNEIIFYLNYNSKHGILANIDSLCKSMYNLLPDSKKNQAVDMLCNDIKSYINKPKESEVYSFANAVILLGIWWLKIWDVEQQNIIKAITVDLIKFFLFNPICEKHLHGLISETIIFNWYYIYDWTLDWNLIFWEDFIRSIYDNSQDIYEIYDENDYKVKIEIFINFYKNPVIEKLLTPLAIYILNNQKDDLDGVGFVPDEIDDDYKIPTSHLDGKIFEFNTIIQELKSIPCDELVNIVYALFQNISNYNNGDYETRSLFNELVKKWKQSINTPTEAGCYKIYEIIKFFINDKNGIYISDFSSNLDYLSDESKERILGDVIKEKDLLKNNVYLFIVISKLLNLSDKEKALSLFMQIQKSCDTIFIKDIIRTIHSNNKNHTLFETSERLFKKYFSKEIKQENVIQKKIKQVIASAEDMQKNEVKLIQSKSLLLSEIDRIDTYLSVQQKSKEGINRHNIYELSVDSIKNNITFDYDNSYTIPPIFSDFVINLIRSYYNDDFLKAVTKTKKCIEEYFSKESLFWEFFYWHYMTRYSEEEAVGLLNSNHSLKSKFIKSLESDVKEKFDTLTLENADKHTSVLRNWLTPFIICLKYFYDGKIPLWFDKDKLPLLTVYSSWNLKLTPGEILDTNFPWLGYKSVFDWLKVVAGLEIKNLVKQSISYYPKLTRPESKAQLLTYYIDNLDKLVLFKPEIEELLIHETLIEIEQDYSSKDSNVLTWKVLPKFWNMTNNNYIDKLIEYIPFEKYKIETKNGCLNSVLEYFIRVATKEQKERVIQKLRKLSKQKNITELLSILGYERANISIIYGYLHGVSISNNIYFSREKVLCQNKKSNKLLVWYMRLLEYSLKKNSDRRNSLYIIAQQGLKLNITKKSFKIVKIFLMHEINKRRKKNQYFLGLQDFLDELEQIAFV